MATSMLVTDVGDKFEILGTDKSVTIIMSPAVGFTNTLCHQNYSPNSD